MIKFFALFAVACIASACESMDLTPEQARALGASMSGFANDLDQQSQRNYNNMQDMSPTSEDCQVIHLGGGRYRKTCY